MLTLNIIREDSEKEEKIPFFAKELGREEIRMDQTPTERRWSIIPLYKISANGGMLFWQIGFDGIDHLEISHGYNDGIIRTDRTEVKTDERNRR